ncbi:MAG: glycosyltransferase family 4 protein [Acidobacteriaceae bacterium]
MRILLIVDSYLPEPKATGPLFQSLSHELARRGHEVTVLTVTNQTGADCSIAEESGIRVIRVRGPKLKGIPLARRAINEFLLSRTVWSRAARAIAPLQAEIVAFYSPTIFWGPLIEKLKRIWNCRAVLILRDIFPQWALDAGQIRQGPHYWLLQRYAELQYKLADRIGIQSPRNAEFFHARFPQYVPKLGVLFNWVEDADSSKAEDPRAALAIASDIPVLLYGGNLGSAQDPDLLLECARAFSRGTTPNAFLLVIGEGSATERLTRSIRQERLANIAFWPSVPQSRFLAIARACDAGVIALNRSLTTYNFPGKLLTYISAGLPVLASVNRGNDLRGIVESANAGLCNWADLPSDFIENAERMAGNPRLREQLSGNVRLRLRQTFSVGRAGDFVLG